MPPSVAQTNDNTGGQIWAIGGLFQGFPVEFLQFISSQNGCVRLGIVVDQNHISDWLITPFGLVCGFHIVQKLAVVRSIHSTTFVKEVDEQYAFPVPKNGCENFSS
jgi:hypothetical protein